MNEKQRLEAQRILDSLSRQRFADWYNTGGFDAYIRGGRNAPSEDAILVDICNMFNIAA